jgi:predicted MFS family arabinose efflux permease
MIALETVTGSGMAIFYPASQALLPRLVPGSLLQQASALSRLAMNTAQMGGAAIAGAFVAAAGPGWALAICGAGMVGTVPVLLTIRAPGEGRRGEAGLLRDLRDGWAEFISRRWLWVIVAQFSVVMACWYGGFQVLGPVVAQHYLGGPAAWGAITAADATGLIAGGLVSLRFTPRRPIRFAALSGGACALSPLSLAMGWPLAAVCGAALALGVTVEIMMVQWTVALARHIPAGKLARVSSYDILGSVLAMPAGALAAGPAATAIGLRPAEYAAAALTVIASALALVPREVRVLGVGESARPGEVAPPAVTGP